MEYRAIVAEQADGWRLQVIDQLGTVRYESIEATEEAANARGAFIIAKLMG